MIKIDTKKIRDGEGGCNYKTINLLCTAYDEAQKEIGRAVAGKKNVIELSSYLLREKNDRISTLEALLREALKSKASDFLCPFCLRGYEPSFNAIIHHGELYKNTVKYFGFGEAPAGSIFKVVSFFNDGLVLESEAIDKFYFNCVSLTLDMFDRFFIKIEDAND